MFKNYKEKGVTKGGVLDPGGSRTGTVRADSKNVAQSSGMERLPRDRTIIAQTRPFSSSPNTHTNTLT